MEKEDKFILEESLGWKIRKSDSSQLPFKYYSLIRIYSDGRVDKVTLNHDEYVYLYSLWYSESHDFRNVALRIYENKKKKK